MAIVAVKASKAVTTTGTTATLTALTATAGNALLVSGGGFVGNLTGSYTVTRTGDTYATDVSGRSAGGPTSGHGGIASAPNVVAGGADMVLTINNAAGVSLFAMEFSGCATSSIRDATSPAIATGNSTAPASSALTNVTAEAVYIGCLITESGANPATITVGTSYTQAIGATTTTNLNGSNSQVAGEEYQIVASTSSRTATWTIDSNQWGAMVAVYKASGAAAATSLLPYRRPFRVWTRSY